MNYLQKVQADKSGLLWLVTGKHRDSKAWWFVLVQPLKLPLFKKALGGPNMLLTDYGDIIESGYGAFPAESDLELIRGRGYVLDDSIAGESGK